MYETHLVTIGVEERKAFLDYLLLADECVEMVSKYINTGEMFAIHWKDQFVGVVLFTFHPNGIVELKNIAIIEAYRGKGVGKSVIQEAFHQYKMRGLQQMIVGTANSSIDNLAFYQKLGFRMAEIKRGFFEKYPAPIYENGIRALDMVMLDIDL